MQTEIVNRDQMAVIELCGRQPIETTRPTTIRRQHQSAEGIGSNPTADLAAKEMSECHLETVKFRMRLDESSSALSTFAQRIL